MSKSEHGAPTAAGIDPQAAFRAVVEHQGGLGGARGGFGSGALKADGRIFASLSHGRLLLKLSAERVDALIASGTGERFSTGSVRPKREWVTIGHPPGGWIELSEEARRFVGAEKKTGRR